MGLLRYLTYPDELSQTEVVEDMDAQGLWRESILSCHLDGHHL